MALDFVFSSKIHQLITSLLCSDYRHSGRIMRQLDQYCYCSLFVHLFPFLHSLNRLQVTGTKFLSRLYFLPTGT